MTSELSWTGVGRGLLLLALIWWAWSAFVWIANATDPDSPTFRLALVVGLIAIFICGLAVPHAFGERSVFRGGAGDTAVLFAVSYALVRFIHLGLYTQASRRGDASWDAIVGFAAATTVGMVLLIAGAFADGSTRMGLWLAAIALDYAGPAWLTRKRLAGLQGVAVAHFAERYGLFIIICLGESIVEIGSGAFDHAVTFGFLAAIALSLLIVVGLWWTYFGHTAPEAEQHLRRDDNPVLAAADAYSYIHLLLVAGIVLFAFGARWAIAGVSASLDPTAQAGLFGGVALYLVGVAAFRLRLTNRVERRKLVSAVILVIAWAVTRDSDAWIALVVIAVVLAALTFAENSEVASPA
jgi:low temperature requirement protein LtrA